MNLRVYGLHAVIELAPVLLAMERHSQGKAKVADGNIGNLFCTGHWMKPEVLAQLRAAGLDQMGPAHLATNAETQALRLSLIRPDLRLLMTVAEGHYRIVARRSAGIESIQDLRGKRVATHPWTSAAYYLARELQSVGLPEDTVTIVPRRDDKSYVMQIVDGDADAVAIWEPASQDVADALGEDLTILQTPGVYHEIFSIFTAERHLNDAAMRGQIVDFLRSIIRASQEIARDPSAAIALVAEASGYGTERVTRSWPHHKFVAKLDDNLLDALVAEEQWLSQEDGRQARTRSELAQLIDSGPYHEAMSS